ncbi:TolC family protein, partial [Rhizorhabdus wittichii]|uniref:TolC family protein n=1 Tax=Rhizorhabdus wittichii TaxID=160791 RepID=UPI00035CDE76
AIAAPTIRLDAALPVPDALPADLLGRRPDILAARARIEAAEAGRKVARADFYPDIDLKGFIGLQAIGLGALFTGGAATYGAGPALHLPIFEGGRLKANYKGAVAGIDEAVASYNGAVVGAVRETADALSAIATNAADAAEQHKVVAGLGETVRLDEVRLRTGLGARLDVLDAGDRLLAANQREVDLAADGAAARIRLLVAVGGSFDPHSRQNLASAAGADAAGR